MDWLFDNATAISILLGIIALGCVAAWWHNRRTQNLAYAGAALLGIALLWLLGQVVVTDSQQLRRNVDAMAEAVLAQNTGALFKHVAQDFAYRGLDRKQLHDAVAHALKLSRAKGIVISSFRVEEVSRATGKAHVSFLVRVEDSGGGMIFFARCEADFVLNGEAWLLRGIEFFNPVANQDQPMNLPL